MAGTSVVRSALDQDTDELENPTELEENVKAMAALTLTGM